MLPVVVPLLDPSPGQEVVRVLLVSWAEEVAEQLRELFADVGDLQIVGASEVDDESGLLDNQNPDVVVFDPGRPGLPISSACRRLLAKWHSSRLIVVNYHTHAASIIQALAMGARGIVLGKPDRKSLLQAVRAVAAGGTSIDPRVADKVVAMALGRQPDTPFGLSSQELRVLALVAGGFRNKEIGKMLQISEPTVKSHIRRILKKLRVSDRAAAATLAIRRGLA